MWINCPECNKKIYYSDVVCLKCGYPFYEKLDDPNYRISPYDLNNDANTLLEKLNKKYTESFEERVIELLHIISQNNRMSAYQLSLTYKKFGDFYLKYEMNEKALSCYENGLKLNTSLPVKRKIKELKSLLIN